MAARASNLKFEKSKNQKKNMKYAFEKKMILE